MFSSKSCSTGMKDSSYSLVPFQSFSTLAIKAKKKTETTETKCGHKFHFNCLQTMSDSLGNCNQMRCPLCRANIEKDRFIIKNIGKLAYADWDGEYRRICQNTHAEEMRAKHKQAQALHLQTQTRKQRMQVGAA
eukprot:Awhi_evm1s5274